MMILIMRIRESFNNVIIMQMLKCFTPRVHVHDLVMYP